MPRKEQRRYRKLYVRIWREPKFRALSAAHKVVTLYLLTGPQTNRMGCYVLSPGEGAEDLSITLGAFHKGRSLACETFGWQWDPVSRVFWIPTWFEWNEIDNPKALKGAIADLVEVPECDLKRCCLDTVSHTFERFGGNGMPYQEQEKEKEKEKEKEQEQEQDAPSVLPPPDRRQNQQSLIARQNLRIVNPGGVVQCWDWMFRDLMRLAAPVWSDEGERRTKLYAWIGKVDEELLASGTVPHEDGKVFWPKRFRAEFGKDATPTATTAKTAGNLGVVQRFIERGKPA